MFTEKIHKEAKEILTLLKENKIIITTAESCTGGAVAAAITDFPGSSAVIKGSYVTYSDEAKQFMLGISKEILKKHGAVSREVAAAMAFGAFKQSTRYAEADIALSVTGFAGPDSNQKGVPVGRVYIGLHNDIRKETTVEEFTFSGGRDNIREQAVIAAFNVIKMNL